MGMGHKIPVIMPGSFSFTAKADRMRDVYDKYNEQIVTHRIAVYFDFIGESITEYWDLDVYFRTPDGLLVNRGASGDITPIMLMRFHADVTQLSPRYVHIMGGTNNTWRLDATDPVQRRTPEQIYQSIIGDITAMVRLAKQSGIVPIVGSNLPIGVDLPCLDPGFRMICPNQSTAVRNELITSSNFALKQMASNEEAVYVDYHSHLAGPDGKTLQPVFSDDSLHPNVNGYDMMAYVLHNTLAVNGIRLEQRRFVRREP